MNGVSMQSIGPRTIRKQDIDEILYNTYATGGWNSDYEQIPVQRRLKFMNGVVREVIKNPELAKKDPTRGKIFAACMKNVRKLCEINNIKPEQIEPFCRNYTKNVLGLDEKYVPQVMASLFGMGQLSESFDRGIKSAHNSLRAMEINYDNALQAEQAAFAQKTIRPDTQIAEALKRSASADAYRQAG